MTVAGIDHVNIRAASLADTVRFYTDIVGLTYAAPPEGFDPAQIAWLVDASGHAVLHLTASEPTDAPGPVDHVALDCSGLAVVLARLDGRAAPYGRHRFDAIDLEQVFVTDPNGVRIELNFRSGRH